jgi:hypothetical protein
LFHPDLMTYGLGTEVKVVIENIPIIAAEDRIDFLRAVMLAVKSVFPDVRKVIGEAHLRVVDSDAYLIIEDH